MTPGRSTTAPADPPTPGDYVRPEGVTAAPADARLAPPPKRRPAAASAGLGAPPGGAPDAEPAGASVLDIGRRFLDRARLAAADQGLTDALHHLERAAALVRPALVDDRCPHRGGPLSLGRRDASGRAVICPWHGNAVPVRTLCRGAVPAVWRRDGTVVAVLPEAAGPVVSRRPPPPAQREAEAMPAMRPVPGPVPEPAGAGRTRA